MKYSMAILYGIRSNHRKAIVGVGSWGQNS